MSDVLFISSVRNPSGTYRHTIPMSVFENLTAGARVDSYSGGTFVSREWMGFGWKLKTKSGKVYRVKSFGMK